MCDFGGGDVEVLGYLCGGFAECFECVAVVSELECGLVDGVLFFESLGDGGFDCGDGVEFGLEFLAGFFACGEVGCGGGFFLCHLHIISFFGWLGILELNPSLNPTQLLLLVCGCFFVISVALFVFWWRFFFAHIIGTTSELAI